MSPKCKATKRAPQLPLRVWPPLHSPQAYKRRVWPLLKRDHSRDKRLLRTELFDLSWLLAQYHPHHFTGLFIGSKPLPRVSGIPFTRLWVLVWFPPTHTLVESLIEYFLSSGCYHWQKSGSYFCFDFLWLSLLTLHSSCTFFWDNKEVGHLPVWICSLWLCSDTKIYSFTFFTFQICPVGDYIPFNVHSFHGPHPRLSSTFSLMPTHLKPQQRFPVPFSFLFALLKGRFCNSTTLMLPLNTLLAFSCPGNCLYILMSELLSCKLLPWISLMGPFPEGKAVDLFQLTEIAMKLASGWGRFHRKREQRQNELITAFTQCQVLKEFNCFSAIGLFRYVYGLHDGRVVKK